MENNWVLQSKKQSCRVNEKPWLLQKKAHAKDALAVQACPRLTWKGVTVKESWQMLQIEEGVSGGRDGRAPERDDLIWTY